MTMLVNSYIAKTDSFMIEGDLLIPGDVFYDSLDLEDESSKKRNHDNQSAAAEFMNIKNVKHIIEFCLKRGIISRREGETTQQGQSIKLILADVALLNWTDTLIRFLQGRLDDYTHLIPTEQVIQHYAEYFAENGNDSNYIDPIKQLLPEDRLNYAIRRLNNRTQRMVDTDDLNLDGKKIDSGKHPFPSKATRFAQDVVNAIGRTTCKQVYNAPVFDDLGNMSWNMCETALVPRLYYEYFCSIESMLLDRCKCGHMFLKSRKDNIYCSKNCLKRFNMRKYREKPDVVKPKSNRGRKKIPIEWGVDNAKED